MAQLTVSNLDEAVQRRLGELAKSQGISIEEAARIILQAAFSKPIDQRPNLGSRIASRFSNLGFEGEIEELRGHTIDPLGFN